MKKMFALGAGLLVASGTALASHCPTDVKAIDAALAKNPKLSAAQMKDVKAQRDAGEAAHKAGKHKEAEESLHKAMATLGIEHKK
jgi:hypothetical protein